MNTGIVPVSLNPIPVRIHKVLDTCSCADEVSRKLWAKSAWGDFTVLALLVFGWDDRIWVGVMSEIGQNWKWEVLMTQDFIGYIQFTPDGKIIPPKKES